MESAGGTPGRARRQAPRSEHSGSDALAADYFPPGEWARLRPERPQILNDALRRRVGWGVAHLTYGRASARGEVDLEPSMPMRAAVDPYYW